MGRVRSRMRNWFHSAAGIVSVILLSASVILTAIVCLFINPNTNSSIVRDLLIGLAANLLGIIITVSFVQYFINRQNNRNEKEEEIKRIKRYNRHTSMLIRRYQELFYALTTRIKDRKYIEYDSVFNRQFTFADMADMYLPSLTQTDAIMESTIVLFFNAEQNLRDYFLKMIENIDYRYNEKLYEIIQTFVTDSINKDMSGVIIGNKTVNMGDKPLAKVISSWISDEAEDWLGKYKRGELTNNIMYSYVVFYYHLRNQAKHIKEYLECMNSI